MNVFKIIVSPIVFLFKTLNGAREFIEDRIADVLDTIQKCETIDTVEKKLICAGVEAGLTYFLGTCLLNKEQIKIIADTIVEKGINTINPAVSKQLRK